MKSLFTKVALAFATLTSSVFAADKDIVDTAVAAGSFKTLVAAVQAADLVEALKGEGPFTVFAPSDEAFAKLPKDTIATLLKPENKGTLAGILTYHVVPGKVFAKQVVGLSGAKSLNGQQIDISTKDGKVFVDGAQVVSTDIQCSNGVIHVIDSVILPADKNIVETADAAGSFKTLIAAAKAAGLVEALTGKGPITVFAPTDEAFAKLPEGTIASLLEPANKQKLVDILKYHVVAGRVYSTDALKAKTAKTLQGGPVSIGIKGGAAKVNDSKLVKTDLDASNGVIHVIDTVLMPGAKGANARAAAKAKLEKAVAAGSSMFNHGDHAGCAAHYMTTLNGLMDADLGNSLKSHMTSVISAAKHQTCPTERSWTLRRGIDQMYTQLVK